MTFDAANLSPHFTLAEMTVTSTGMTNRPDSSQIVRLMGLCEQVLEPIRAEWGPLHITSGFRSPETNAVTAGASKTSQHMRGEAADFQPLRHDATCEAVFAWLAAGAVPFDQAILEYGARAPWVHVSYSPAGTPRRQALIQRAGRYAEYTRKDGGS